MISKDEVIQRLDLDAAMYATLASSFAEMVDESIRLLSQPRDAGCIPSGFALNGLHEAAIMFGIDGLQSVTRQLIEQTAAAATPSTVEVELGRLACVLRSVTSSLRREAAEQDPPAPTDFVPNAPADPGSFEPSAG